jgi:hypothetical protein
MTKESKLVGRVGYVALLLGLFSLILIGMSQAQDGAPYQKDANKWRWGNLGRMWKDKTQPETHEHGEDHERERLWAKYAADELLNGLEWKLVCPAGTASVEVKECPFGRQRRFLAEDLWSNADLRKIRIKHATPLHSDIALTQTIVGTEVRKKTGATLSFRHNSPTSNVIHIVLKNKNDPRDIWQDSLRLSPEEQTYEKALTLQPFKPGDYSLHFDIGENAGLINLSCIQLKLDDSDPDMQQLTKQTRDWLNEEYNEIAMFVPAQIKARIARLRQGPLTVLVQDKAGNPVANAKVDVTQLRHQFLFGCRLDGLRLDDHSVSQINYQHRFANLFNYANVPCYWDTIEPQAGKRDYKKIEAMAKWCVDNHITPNGYGLISPSHCPAWTLNNYPAAIGQLRATVIDCIKHLGNLIQCWDLLDNMSSMKYLSKPNIMRDWDRQDKSNGIIERALLWAQAAASGEKQTLIISEGTKDFDKILLSAKTLPDVIGIIAERRHEDLPPKAAWSICDSMQRFGKPIQFTNLAILSAKLRTEADYYKTYTNWDSTRDGEAKQADEVAQLYNVLFSNPTVIAICWRDLSDQGAWMGAPGGLLRRDGTPKPAYNRLMDLIHKQWWTNAPPKPTDEHGVSSTRAYFGTYEVTVRDSRGHTVKRIITFTPASQREANIITIGN